MQNIFIVKYKALTQNFVPRIIHNNSSSYSENYKDSTPQRAKIHKYPPLLVQAYSMLFILNQHLCRQGKFFELWDVPWTSHDWSWCTFTGENKIPTTPKSNRYTYKYWNQTKKTKYTNIWKK